MSDTKGLCAILTSAGMLEAVEDSIGNVARSLVNLLQACIDHGDLDVDTKRRLIRTLIKLSKSSHQVPQSLMLDGVTIGVQFARGGSGNVYKGTLGRQQVAIKIMQRRGNIEHAVMTAAREAVTSRQLVHPNVTPFYGVFREDRPGDQAVCLVSALMDCNLLFFLKHKGEYAHCIWLALDITYGLQYMHEVGIFHGDLKSINILVSANGRAYLTDFGIAKSFDITNQQTTGVGGTLLWMAPELFDKSPKVTKASDIYALGMVFYEMFSGLTPFEGQQIGAQPPSLRGERPPKPGSDTPADDRGFNHDIWRCIEKCWAQEANERPSTKQVAKVYIDEVDPPGSKDPRPSDSDIASPSSLLRSLDGVHESISHSFMIW
ncbi:kinase-like protein [Athelia psychrophila]|uniref:Kinase-like protein n=1 Tax=Athelia psychrophila TaxID=1759441 RepID=A0A166QKX8_9AGAM|nr:kinase-like protein [Fibularhizoctonia sp. CBS 109695]